MKITLFLALCSLLAWDSTWGEDDSVASYAGHFKRLEGGIPVLDPTHQGEGGFVVSGHFGEVPHQRLVLWAEMLVPRDDNEVDIARKYFRHTAKELRFISQVAVARYCSIERKDLAGDMSYSDPLWPRDSPKFKRFLAFVESRLTDMTKKTKPKGGVQEE